jgi:hypothetical protein
MRPKKSSDDQSTVSIKRQDDVSTVAVRGATGKKSKASSGGETELDLIHSYWRSGLPALKRQAVSRYAQLTGVKAEQAEAALAAWSRQQGPNK